MAEAKIASEFDYIKINKKDLLEITIHNETKKLQTITIKAIGMNFLKYNENNENINNKGEYIMRILDLYEEKEIKRIRKEIDEKIEKVELSGETAKIAKKIKKIAKEELEKKGITDDLIDVSYKDTDEVIQEKEKILKLNTEKRKELSETIAEIKALLDITENFEQKMKILKSYGVVTQKGTLSN